MIRVILSAVLGYVLGLIPSSQIAARLSGRPTHSVDDEGTGNPGALNSAHTLGKGWGVAVMTVDITKGAGAGALGAKLAGSNGANAAAAAAVIGHCYPATRNWKGGKGVATSVGQVVATFPPYLPVDFAVGAATVALPFWKQRTMAANTVASVVWTGSAVLAWRRQLPNLWGPAPTAALPLAAATSSAVIFKRFLDERHSVAEFNTPSSSSAGGGNEMSDRRVPAS